MAERSNILVVDDEDVITGAAHKILGAEQWDVRIAATARGIRCLARRNLRERACSCTGARCHDGRAD